MNLSFYKFIDKDEFMKYLANSNLVLCKRNYISRFCDIYGLLSPEGHLEAACVIQKLESNKLFIKLFEVSSSNYRKGIGTRFFNNIKYWYKDFNYFTTFELESLDDESDAFWKHLGFNSFENEDGETLYKLTIC